MTYVFDPTTSPLGEQHNGYELRMTGRGMYGKRKFLVLWGQWEGIIPKHGDAFDPGNPGLVGLGCTELYVRPAIASAPNGSPVGQVATHQFVEAIYSTDPVFQEATVDSVSIGGEVYDVGPGKVWVSDGTFIADQSINQFVPIMQRSVEISARFVNVGIILPLYGCINAYPWDGYPSECVRFDGLDGRCEWDYDALLWKYRITCKFSIKTQSWNLAYRQDVGYWDYTDPPLYPYGDFADVLGWG